jgi:hypothetical protein
VSTRPDRPLKRWLLACGVVALLCVLPSAGAASTPVNAQLPWHAAHLDRNGRLQAWYRPNDGLGFDRVLTQGWRFLERRVPVDRRAGVKVYLAYAVYDEHTLQGTYWQHNPASLYASLVDALLPWYAYSGDRHAIATVGGMLDYQLAHGTTPQRWSWGSVPFATSCGGARTYGGCFSGAPRSRRIGIETDKVALLGYGYLRFYELTGKHKYLRAAIACANALAQHVRPGDATHTPWAFRVDGRTGRAIADAEYGGAVVASVELFDELQRLHLGDGNAYARARTLAWDWLLRYPLDPKSRDANRWSGYYEDMPYDPDDLNQVLPMLTADYLLEQHTPKSTDPDWNTHVAAMLSWVRTEFGRGPFDGAVGIDEQHWGHAGCCSGAGLGSDTARWAAGEALYAARTNNAAARSAAIRSLSYATYFAQDDGRVSCCGTKAFQPAYWFSDGYGDYLGNISRALGALPELAPKSESHIVQSSSVVQAVHYRARAVSYRTFARRSREVLRLDFAPQQVLDGDRALPRRQALTGPGYTVRTLAHGMIVEVQHDHPSVDVVG